jgi:uncharacterized protein (DUF302 family)
MSYYFSKTIDKEFDVARQYIVGKLQTFGFGIVSEIDMDEKFRQKLGVDFRRYKILGACSPKHAYTAVNLEKHIGLMLPCNVVLQEIDPYKTEVSVIDPIASMQAVKNQELANVAAEIQLKLKEFIDTL